NFTVRGQSAGAFESEVRYTNRFLEFIEPRMSHEGQAMNASGVAADFETMRIHFTNGFSTADPQTVARAIGPKVERLMEPYRFSKPPTVRVEGYAPLKGTNDADLHFGVDGGPFECWKFKSPHVSGQVDWLGKTMTLTNVVASFYGGQASGNAFFSFQPEGGGC